MQYDVPLNVSVGTLGALGGRQRNIGTSCVVPCFEGYLSLEVTSELLEDCKTTMSLL